MVTSNTKTAILGVILVSITIALIRSSNERIPRPKTAGKSTIQINSPNNKDIIEFLHRSIETNNKFVTVRQTIAQEVPCGNLPQNREALKRPCTPKPHYHRYQDERFDVEQGTMGYIIGEKEGIVNTNDHLVIPKGVGHTFWNAGQKDLIVNITLYSSTDSANVYPADSYFENVNGVRRDSPHNIAELYIQFTHGVYRADIPYIELLEPVIRIVAPILGFKIQYPEYTTNLQ
jgi:mannose-6-phosphate isomerase-like protein (cupin superfamily)